jgi:antitoxin HicB
MATPKRVAMKQAKGRRPQNKAIGSSFDSFLAEKGILEEVHARAIKEVVAWQLDQRRRELKLSKRAMAERMKTSRTQIERLLDPTNDHVQLDTLQKAARLVGREIRIQLVEPARAKRAA